MCLYSHTVSGLFNCKNKNIFCFDCMYFYLVLNVCNNLWVYHTFPWHNSLPCCTDKGCQSSTELGWVGHRISQSPGGLSSKYQSSIYIWWAQIRRNLSPAAYSFDRLSQVIKSMRCNDTDDPDQHGIFYSHQFDSPQAFRDKAMSTVHIDRSVLHCR